MQRVHNSYIPLDLSDSEDDGEPEPSSDLADLENDGERILGFDPILKFSKKSQGEYNIIVKLQRFCLKLLRIYGYIRQNKDDYYFGIKFLKQTPGTIPRSSDFPEIRPLIPRDYEMRLIWQHSENILQRAVQPFLMGEETRDIEFHFDADASDHALFKRSNSRLLVLDKPPGIFPESRPFLFAPPNAMPNSKTVLKITDFQPDGNRSVNTMDGEEKMAYVPKSPGVKDEVTRDIFEILCIDVHKFKSVAASGKKIDSFIGPPGSWFYDGEDNLHARQYAIVIGLGMLKMIETPHAGDFDTVETVIEEIKHAVERILTVYCGGELWRELLRHVQIEMEGYVKVPKFPSIGGKTKKNKIKNNKNKKIKSKKTKSKKNKSKKNKTKQNKNKSNQKHLKSI
jgi:hypothetical protein